ncbi:TetR/AcrR family transcriptional regulator [Actinophytocola sp.]|uniref:TetR/AcrR family transcriptional regulator n=1 Tax=Actinophytocola sp. TaxID=1872138 RepID=UPI003D6BCCA1
MTNLLEDRSGARAERADAARNRAKVLKAAERVFAERDPRTVTMVDIARAAGVGRATLYRRYPDPASVAVALLDEHERQLQEQLMFGSPPLGPGAPPGTRLAAFYHAMIDLLDRHLHLALGAETGQPRLATGAYGFWRTHVRELVRASGVGDPDALADVLLAPLAPEVYRAQRDEAGLTKARIADTLALLAQRLLGVH